MTARTEDSRHGRKRDDSDPSHTVVTDGGIPGPPEDRDPSIKRRAVLGVVGAGAVGGLFYYRDTLGNSIESAVRTLEDRDDPESQYVGLENVEWDGETLVLTIESREHVDGWSIAHEGQSFLEDPLFIGRVPEGGGTLELPFGRVVAQQNGQFPTRTFVFAGLSGRFSHWEEDGPNHIDEVHGTVQLHAPRSIVD